MEMKMMNMQRKDLEYISGKFTWLIAQLVLSYSYYILFNIPGWRETFMPELTNLVWRLESG